MMKKIFLYLLLGICIPRMINAMEFVQKVEQLASSPEAKDIETKVIGFIQSPTGQNLIKEGVEKIESFFSHTTTTTATTSTTAATSTMPTIIVSNPAANAIIASQSSVQASDQQSSK